MIQALKRWFKSKAISTQDVFPGRQALGDRRLTTGRTATASELVDAFRGVAYTCARLNALTAASVPLRLYARTGRVEKAVRFWPTRAVPRQRAKSLAARPYLAKVLGDASDVQEILDHPVLRLLDRPNPYQSRHDLLELIFLYVDVVGSAYWHVVLDGLGVPRQIWTLPAHQVTPTPRYSMSSYDDPIVSEYWYSGAHWSRRYLADDPSGKIVHFRHPDLRDPYLASWSPLQAAWDQFEIQDEWLAHERTMTRNNARPDAIVTPKDSAFPIGRTEAARLEKWLNAKFRQGGAGSLMVAEEALDVKPFSWSPRDLSSLQIRQFTKEEIANAFDVPVALLKTQDVNRANAEAADYQHRTRAIRPRLAKIDEALNYSLASMYDERLFFAHDDCVPSDEAAERERHKTYFAMGLPLNTILGEAGYDPVPDGDTSLVPNTLAPLKQIVSPPEPPPNPAPAGVPDIAATKIASLPWEQWRY